MQPRELNVGDVVQIDPEHDPRFGACLMVVTEPKAWGAQGYVTVPGGEGQGGNAYYRCPWAAMEFVGHAEWIVAHRAPEAPDAD